MTKQQKRDKGEAHDENPGAKGDLAGLTGCDK
jgi:hypothetical protein